MKINSEKKTRLYLLFQVGLILRRHGGGAGFLRLLLRAILLPPWKADVNLVSLWMKIKIRITLYQSVENRDLGHFHHSWDARTHVEQLEKSVLVSTDHRLNPLRPLVSFTASELQTWCSFHTQVRQLTFTPQWRAQLRPRVPRRRCVTHSCPHSLYIHPFLKNSASGFNSS